MVLDEPFAWSRAVDELISELFAQTCIERASGEFAIRRVPDEL